MSEPWVLVGRRCHLTACSLSFLYWYVGATPILILTLLSVSWSQKIKKLRHVQWLTSQCLIRARRASLARIKDHQSKVQSGFVGLMGEAPHDMSIIMTFSRMFRTTMPVLASGEHGPVHPRRSPSRPSVRWGPGGQGVVCTVVATDENLLGGIPWSLLAFGLGCQRRLHHKCNCEDQGFLLKPHTNFSSSVKEAQPLGQDVQPI